MMTRTRAGDEAATHAFVERIPEAEQRFFKDDVLDPGTVPREGLGSQLVWKALAFTRELDHKKLVVEVLAEQDSAVAMFQGLGFHREAVLPGHVRDREGKEHDLVPLANTGLLAAELQGATS